LIVVEDEEDVRAERLRVRPPAIDPDAEERVQAVAERHRVHRASGVADRRAALRTDGGDEEPARQVRADVHEAALRDLAELLRRPRLERGEVLPADEAAELRPDVARHRLPDPLLALQLAPQRAAVDRRRRRIVRSVRERDRIRHERAGARGRGVSVHVAVGPFLNFLSLQRTAREMLRFTVLASWLVVQPACTACGTKVVDRAAAINST
jgi:hypothetical protein